MTSHIPKKKFPQYLKCSEEKKRTVLVSEPPLKNEAWNGKPENRKILLR